MLKIFKLILYTTATLLVFNTLAQKQLVINPGEKWADMDGNHIQAHGGGVIKIGKTYYWYGEQRSKEFDIDTVHHYVSCYASKDLINWKFKGNAIKLARPDTALEGKHWVLERPKVYYNKKTKKYVMYMHIDGVVKGKRYGFASVGVAISNKPEGPFKYLNAFRPLGKESRDIGQFIDDDGSAYLIFESRPSKGFYIAKLSDDFLTVEKEVSFIQAPLEGGAIVHYKGLYYVIGSALTSWAPNPNKVATATSLAGPWSTFSDIAPPETNTYSSQSTMLLKVEGKKQTTVLYMGDRWKPSAQWDSRYLWMPVEIQEGKVWIPKPKPWHINVKTGEVRYIEQINK
ncbi:MULTISPECIES: family 43 glycosylhydrolase [Arcicella]|uniref:Family 43 glycosylhydrolase n=2 Tax=Arcicella TaxID=217140 RepID=A0ABU5SQ19_9BACT|nr:MULTISPECIES: family 43 glycosylhydrolase [unclassified Arcicella]MEA5402746.1 family 43 glycosylhydrolase [Arcicella sp. DC2W]MEA5429391.1 family 43 glycosylhydrolase [Arcicella sp. DC25W]